MRPYETLVSERGRLGEGWLISHKHKIENHLGVGCGCLGICTVENRLMLYFQSMWFVSSIFVDVPPIFVGDDTI